MGQDEAGNASTSETAAAWAEEFGLTFPVIADANWAGGYAGNYLSGGIPAKSLLAPGAEIVILDGWVDGAEIEQVLPGN